MPTKPPQRPPSPIRLLRRLAIGLAAAALVATGCGGSQSERDLLAANGFTGLESSPAPAAGTGADRAAPAPATPAAAMVDNAASITAGPAPAQFVSGTNATAPARAGAPAAPATAAGGPHTPEPGTPSAATPADLARTAQPTRNDARAPAPGNTVSSGGPATPSPKAPVKLGVLGARSGVIGAITVPFYDGAVAWAADVNRRGGLAGHPVQLVAYDDGGDPRRALAGAKRLVEEEKVVAFYAQHGFTTFDAIIPYLEDKAMPVVGGCPCNVAHPNTPVYFQPVFSARTGLMWNHLLPLQSFHPEIKDIGVLYCRESNVCSAVNEELQRIGPQHGYRIRYTTQVSIAQPDYTAEVLAARNAGAQALLLLIDNNSAIRIAASAHRQGYNPVFAIQGSAHAEKFLKEGGTDVEGFLVGAAALHWTSPLMADYVAAMRNDVPNSTGLSSESSISWISGKLLERVAPAWPDTPTPADVTASLRALRGETLGGLIVPTTFRPGAVAGNECSVVTRIEHGQFVPYNNRNEWICAPGYHPG